MSATLPPFNIPWAMLNRDARHTAHSYSVGPDDPSVLGTPWPYLTGGRIASSPAIGYDGTAYIGSQDGWLHKVGFNGKGVALYDVSSPILVSPAIYEDEDLNEMTGDPQALEPSRIYFGADNGVIYSISPQGTLWWQLAPGSPQNKTPIRSSPIVTRLTSNSMRVYAGSSNGNIYGIFETGPSTAVTAWQTATAAPLRTSPALSPSANHVYVGAADGRLYYLDAFTGTQLLIVPTNIGAGALTTPVVDAAGNIYVAQSRTLYAFDSNGSNLWQVPFADPISTPVALGVQGEIFVLAGNNVYALSSTGAILWNQAIPNQLRGAGPIVDSTGTVYVASRDGRVFGVSRKPVAGGNRILWTVQVDPAGPRLTTPALDAHGRIYVGADDSRLYAIDDAPAFQIVFDSNLSASTNIEIHSLRETYGVLDPARTFRLTDNPALDQQPVYSLDRSVIAYTSDRDGSQDAFLATAIATEEENLSGPGAPLPPNTKQVNPAFTPINDLTGYPHAPHLKSYMAFTSNDTGSDRLVFIDLEAQANGNIMVWPFTDWATILGVPQGIAQQLEPPFTEQSQIAFSPDGRKIAWRHCTPAQQTGEVRTLIFDEATGWTLTTLGALYHYDVEAPEPCRDSPAFSPDSRWIAIREGLSLVIYDVLGQQAPVVSTPQLSVGDPTHPNWAPDGSEIVVGINSGTMVDLFVASGKGYSTYTQLTSSHRSDEPYYHYFKMPPPQVIQLSVDRQFPGATIDILGRGFDILHPQNNKVYFIDTQRRPEMQEAEVLNATVNPYRGLGVLTVKVPQLAGHGPITVETRFGSSTTSDFYVLPKPARIEQSRSVPGAKVRVFGAGFDLSPATQNVVSFTAAAGGFVTSTALSGGLAGIEEYLIVEVPAGIAETGPIRVDNVFGGSTCSCNFTQLHPNFKIARLVNVYPFASTGLSEYALQGSAGVRVKLEGTDFPFDPYFGYGTGTAHIEIETLVKPMAPIPIQPLQQPVLFAQAGPDTANLVPVEFPFPNLPQMITGHPGGDLRIHARDANWPAINASAPFRIPLTNIPIIIVPGTSGTSLDIAFGTSVPPYIQPPDSHGNLLGQQHSAMTFTYNPRGAPGNDPRGARVWMGPEGTLTITNPINVKNYNQGNHYLDIIAYNPGGTPKYTQIVPGTVLYDVTIDIPVVGRTSINVYKSLIDFLIQPNPLDPVGWPGRPLCNGLNPIFPTIGTETCFNMSRNAAGVLVNGTPASGHNAVYLFNLDWRNGMPSEAKRLSDFIDTILARPDIKAAGVKKVVLITHSYGGPVSRWYYLDADKKFNHPEQKVDQMISFGGGFHGVIQPFDILEEGSNWDMGWDWGPISLGLARWQIQALAQNWPTAYYQLPNSELWFYDHGTNRTGITSATTNKINRAYIRDLRTRTSVDPVTGQVITTRIGAGEIIEYSKSMDWIRSRHDKWLPLEQMTQFTLLGREGYPALGDFRIGTGAVYHHRIIGKGNPQTIIATKLYTISVGDPTKPPFYEFDSVEAVYGDGDKTIPYWGALGLTDVRDDRVYVLDNIEHGDLPNVPNVVGNPIIGGPTPLIIKGLLQMLLEGSICSQPQVPSSLGFLSQNQVTEIV